MKEKWSGKALSRADRAKRAPPSRSSTKRARRRVIMASAVPVAVPVAGTDRLREVAAGPERAGLVDREGQLGQRAGGRSEHRAGPVQHVEQRLVAGTQQLMGAGVVEPHRATGVGAHLG